MRNSKSIAAAVSLFALFGAVLYFRILETLPYESVEPKQYGICIGIVRPDGKAGIVRAKSARDVVARGSDNLLLLEECAESIKGRELKTGDLAIFQRENDGACVLSRLDVLKGSARLLCGQKLNVNREDAAGLMLLPGIGPVKAAAIIESRTKNGPFHSVDDLTRVLGIGEKTATKLLPWLEF
jgi:competence ComEA-like helix-hairpin-helix protein